MASALRLAKLSEDRKAGNWRARKARPFDCRLDFGKRQEKPV